MRAFGRIAGGVLLVAAVLFGVMAFRAGRLVSRQVAAPPATLLTINADSVAAHLGRAVSFATISNAQAAPDSAAFRALHAWLAETYPAAHRAMARETINQLSLLYTWKGTDSTLLPVVLMAHQDVVPVVPGTEGQWTHSPFAGVVDSGFVWGRGSFDDKSALVSIMEAVDALAREGFRPKRTVYLAFGHDEEIGGLQGAVRIRDALDARGVKKFGLVFDEGGAVATGLFPGFDAPMALIGIAEKGYVSLTLTTHGAGGHSSTPPPQTQIGRLARAVDRLERNPFPMKLEGVTSELFATLAPEMPFGKRIVFANLWLFEPLVKRFMAGSPQSASMLRTTTAPTMLSAGIKDNVLPQTASATVNFRIVPGETVASVIAHVREVVADSGVQIEPMPWKGDPSPVSDVHGPGFAVVATSLRQTFGANPPVVAPFLVMGGTDAHAYGGRSDAVLRGSPFLVDKHDLERVHGTDERMAIEGLVNGVRFYAQLLRNLDQMR